MDPHLIRFWPYAPPQYNFKKITKIVPYPDTKSHTMSPCFAGTQVVLLFTINFSVTFPPQKIYTKAFQMTDAKYCFNHIKIRKDSGPFLHPFFIVCAILIICFLLPRDILILSHSNETAYFYGILSV